MPYDFSTPISFRNAGAGGQYGYVDGLPRLNAVIADQNIDANNGYVQGDAAGTSDNAMGWDTGSVNGVLTRGAGIYGIRKNPETDSEGQQTGSFTYSGDMDAAARQLGLNVTGLNDEQKYNLINNATQNLYLVSGKTGRDAGGVGEEYEGRTQTAAIPNATTNHATVLYRKEGDALVPITQTAQYYNGEMELAPGSGLSDFISTVGPIATIAAAASGNPWLAASISAGTTAATGGDLKDIGRNALLAYAGAELGNYFQAPGSTDYLGSAALGDASTGAVGSGSTGFGINPNAAGVGINAGTNAALANALYNYAPSQAGVSDVFADTVNQPYEASTTPITTGNEIPYDWNTINTQPNMTAVNAANAAGAGASNTPSYVQQMTGGTDFSNVAPGEGYTSQGGPAETSTTDLKNAKKLADLLSNTGKSFANSAFPQTGIGQGYSMPNPFYTPKEVQTMAETKTNQPVYLGQLAQLLRG